MGEVYSFGLPPVSSEREERRRSRRKVALGAAAGAGGAGAGSGVALRGKYGQSVKDVKQAVSGGRRFVSGSREASRLRDSSRKWASVADAESGISSRYRAKRDASPSRSSVRRNWDRLSLDAKSRELGARKSSRSARQRSYSAKGQATKGRRAVGRAFRSTGRRGLTGAALGAGAGVAGYGAYRRYYAKD